MRWAMAVGLLLAGCAPRGEWKRDPEVQAKVFSECMASLPKGPEVTRYNDWAEVVEECNDTARDIATRWVEPTP